MRSDGNRSLGYLGRKQLAGFFGGDFAEFDQARQDRRQAAVVGARDLVEVGALAQLFADFGIFLARPTIAGVAGTSLLAILLADQRGESAVECLDGFGRTADRGLF